MKHFISNQKLLFTVFALSLLIVGCSDNEAVENDEPVVQEYTEVSRSAEIDKASESIDDISIEVYEIQEESENNRSEANYNMLPDCVTVTVVMQQNYREITIDFGSEGCLIHGNLLKGQIVLTYTRNPEAQEVFITKSLVDFYFNNKNLVGGKTFLKELSNENGNPQFTKTAELTIIWPNGLQASRNGTKVREWIEGFDTPGLFSDNVFEITGNWSTTFINGNTHNYEVILPLRREVICFYFVSGSIDVERTNFSGVFDYGEGDCDNMATFTFANGEEVDIVLN
ncbi:MAG: hypothetical protein KJO05_12650 [Bacteroidia bacterium]|nr:hypothetical protein [Bacteroidia bacterium]NNF83204.1 hypothetical protein [Flavobacteriaceae bacterium]MBT8263669.1 hypothetical protein [Bacteroidia bacterium]MBT8268382.1 hypothetical protein [Bacteroidia bacterium]NNK69884.1 hypothetical protein [Flavobacteriaceae bacterium]